MKVRIRALLVDDELPALERFTTLLAAHPEVEIVGEAGDVETAAILSANLRPDVIFLDIQLPRASGFDLLPRLEGKPAIVVVTAYDSFALRAFAVNALDYLLKPVHPDRLANCLERLFSPFQASSERFQESDLVALREDSRLSLIPLLSITHIIAEGNYTQVYQLNSAVVLVRRSLAEWANLLPTQTFLRVDRSLIVRLTAVKSLNTTIRESGVLLISGCEKAILLGRRPSLRLRQAMENP